MRRIGARPLPVSAAFSLGNNKLVGGPVRLMGWTFNDGTASQGLQATGSQTTPAAGTTIASLSLGNGTYLVEWTVTLSGTPGASDVNNVGLYVGATQIATSVNLGVAGNYPQQNAQAVVTFGPQTLAAKAIALATTGAIYTVTFTVTPVTDASATVFDGGMAIGYVAMGQGLVDTKWFGDDGILIENQLSVQATLGTITGVLWYYLESDETREVMRKGRAE